MAISSDAIRESSECITDSTRTPSIVENIVGAKHYCGELKAYRLKTTIGEYQYFEDTQDFHILCKSNDSLFQQ
jgi:hypothetical protein